MNSRISTRTQLYVCAAPKDYRFLDELEIHLSPHMKDGSIEIWHYHNTPIGFKLEEEDESKLTSADMLLFLWSPYLEFEYDVDLILKQARPGARIIPILVRAVDIRTSLLRQFKYLPSSGKPIAHYRSRDAIWADIAAQICTGNKNNETNTAIPDIGSRRYFGRLEYFWYISDSKVNNLYAQIKKDSCLPERPDEQGSGVALCQDAFIPYGRTAGSAWTRKILGLEDLTTIIPKQQVVLSYMISRNQIGELNEIISRGAALDKLCYYYSGELSFNGSRGADSVLLVGSVSHNHTILLDCSLKHFSDIGLNNEDGKMVIDLGSSNRAFFNADRKIAYHCKCVILVYSINSGSIIGSPLCIAIARQEAQDG